MFKSILVVILSLSALVGCDSEVNKVDAECYFSSTGTTAEHFTSGRGTAYVLDSNGNYLSAWAWVKHVENNLSDADCHLVK